ncbi:hypothetical protein K1719_012844 [Acacia pycnantha]|nr:hypothetical protein K1719_012844 [Acacia pycnantha]
MEDYGADTDFAKVLNPCDGVSVEYSNPLCPAFSFEEKERERLLRPFRRTLVVKLMGRQPAYGFMVKKLRQIWERKGKIDVFDLENDYFLVSFQHNEDYMGALIGGPWVIADAYLSVSRWKPEFDPRNAKIESLIAWVRFPELPAPLFDKKFLLNLGNAIGKAIRLDIHTAQRSRGKFARMCVELDLTKPLIPVFSVEGKRLSVVYESLNSLCTKCGWFGHSRDGCEGFHKKKAEEGMDVEVQGELGKEEEVGGEKEGIWKTVQRVRRPRRYDGGNQEQKTGSRFAVLREEARMEGSGVDLGSKSGVPVSNEAPEQVPRVKTQINHSKMGKMNSLGGGSNGGVHLRKEQGSRVAQGEKNVAEGRKEKVLLTRRNVDMRNRVQAGDQNMENVSAVPENIMEMDKCKEVDMKEKENLHPGGSNSRVKSRLDDVQMLGMGADLPVCMGTSGGDSFVSPALAEN